VFFAFAQEPVKSEQLTPPGPTQMIMSLCPRLSAQLMERPEFGPVLRDRPIDNAVVCKCTGEKFSTDKRLAQQFALDQPTLAQRMTTDHLRSYVTMRLMHSILSCLLPEMAATLEKSDPAQ
jgi:hypothetical protein